MALDERALGRCGSYELLVELAAGGMATVFLARAMDGRDAPLVAIKRPHRHLAKDKTFLSMLVDEARLASAIHHDNVVKVRELGFDGGEPFIVLDYIEGAALSEVRRDLSAMGRAIDPRIAVRIGLDALAGLHAAHVLHDERGLHLGIVHRDVSPHNVLLGCDGLARVTDFGIAKAADRVQVTHTNEVKGKLAYLAPERIDRRRMCTLQSDVFSMAVVVWECIAGRRLFRGEEPVDTLQEVMTAPIPSLRRLGAPVSSIFDAAILKGLARDLDDRYGSAAEFAASLEAAAVASHGVASHAEVAELIEALFGERLRVRHENIREAIDDRGEVDRVLEISGLNPRPAPTPEMRERERKLLDHISPPAPSARYAFGASERRRTGLSSPWVRWGAAAAAAAGLAFGGVSVARHRLSHHDGSATEPTVRHVVVPLPFFANKVTFDEQSRDFSPPVDVVAFDVPPGAGVRHRVTAIAPDGARAEAYVRESEGVARPEGGDYAIESFETFADAPLASPDAGVTKRVVRRHVAPTAKPLGSVKDGFTKLH